MHRRGKAAAKDPVSALAEACAINIFDPCRAATYKKRQSLAPVVQGIYLQRLERLHASQARHEARVQHQRTRSAQDLGQVRARRQNVVDSSTG